MKAYNQISQSAGYKADDISVSLTVCGGSYGGGSETLIVYALDHVICSGGNCTAQGPCIYEEICPTLKAGGAHAVMSYHGQDAYSDLLITGEIHETMGRNADGSDAVGKKRRGGGQRMPDKMNFNAIMDDTARTLTTQKKERPTTMHTVVRRLTPLECERLQGFPDGWTDIGEWYDSKGKKHKEADSPRYKALGNSIAIPFWEWMAGRICAYYDRPVLLGSLFDGIGGFPLAFSRHGAIPVWASEIEEFPIAVTKRHFPEEDNE